jgi:hypothetical protein
MATLGLGKTNRVIDSFVQPMRAINLRAQRRNAAACSESFCTSSFAAED